MRPDDGKRRYLSFSMDFDTRALMLGMEVEESWKSEVKKGWERNKSSIREELILQYGAHSYEQKETNFIELGTKPFSIISYHNAFFSQARNAFVVGSYYPALVGACALGER